MRGWGLCIAMVALPWEIGLGIWAGTSGHTYIAAGLLAAAVVTIMEAANTGDTRGKAQD